MVQKLEPVEEPEQAKEPNTSNATECPKEVSDQIMNDIIKQYAGKVIIMIRKLSINWS